MCEVWYGGRCENGGAWQVLGEWLVIVECSAKSGALGEGRNLSLPCGEGMNLRCFYDIPCRC